MNLEKNMTEGIDEDFFNSLYFFSVFNEPYQPPTRFNDIVISVMTLFLIISKELASGMI